MFMSFILGFVVGGMGTYYRKEINKWFNSLDESDDNNDNESGVK